MTPRQHLLEQRRELRGGIARGVRRRAAEGRGERVGIAHLQGRTCVEPAEVGDDPVDDVVAEPAHLLGRQRERFGHPPVDSSRAVAVR